MNRRYPAPYTRPLILAQPLARVGRSGQCDACPASIPFAPYPKLPAAAYTVAPITCQVQLDDEHALIHHERFLAPVVLNRSALALAHTFDTPQSLDVKNDPWHSDWGEEIVQNSIHRMASLGILLPVEHTVPRFAESSPELIAWLHLTDRCNMRCSYCFLSHNPEDMSADTGQEVILATFRSAVKHNFRNVKIKYAGGEPLLRFPLVLELHERASDFAQKTDISLDEVILSNGVLLTPAIIDAMLARDIRLMISLDGLGQYHDCQRGLANGRGSSTQVTQAIELAQQYGLTPDISITVTGRSAQGLPELIAWVLERKLPFSLNFYRENDFSLTQQDLQIEDEKMIQGILAAYRVIEQNLPEQSLLAALADRSNLAAAQLRACGVGTNYLVFDTRGRTAKCQMQIQQTVAGFQSLDPLKLVWEDTRGVSNVSVEEKAPCRDCRWKYWCSGGCPLAAYRAFGRYETKSPSCAIVQALFPEILRLEGLRLLKYADPMGN